MITYIKLKQGKCGNFGLLSMKKLVLICFRKPAEAQRRNSAKSQILAKEKPIARPQRHGKQERKSKHAWFNKCEGIRMQINEQLKKVPRSLRQR